MLKAHQVSEDPDNQSFKKKVKYLFSQGEVRVLYKNRSINIILEKNTSLIILQEDSLTLQAEVMAVNKAADQVKR